MNIGFVIVDLLLTFCFYALFPILFGACRMKPVTLKKLRRASITSSVIVFLLLIAFYTLIDRDSFPSVAPAMLWTWVGMSVGESLLRKRELLSPSVSTVEDNHNSPASASVSPKPEDIVPLAENNEHIPLVTHNEIDGITNPPSTGKARRLSVIAIFLLILILVISIVGVIISFTFVANVPAEVSPAFYTTESTPNTMTDNDTEYLAGYDAGYTAGYNEGYHAGYDEGHSIGWDQGYFVASHPSPTPRPTPAPPLDWDAVYERMRSNN